MKLRCVMAAAAAALVSTSASAGDISGFRLEALLGWDNVKVENFGHKSGFAYGAGVGYDLAVGETVSLGLDAEIMGASTSVSEIFVDGSTTYSLKASTGRDIYVGGRVTGKVADRFALYAKAGYANGRITVTGRVGGQSGTFGGNGDGFRLGAGGQFLLGGGSFVGAEYRYTNYESDFVRHQVLANFGFRF